MICPVCHRVLTVVREGFDLGTHVAKCSLCGHEVVYREPEYKSLGYTKNHVKHTKVCCERKG